MYLPSRNVSVSLFKTETETPVYRQNSISDVNVFSHINKATRFIPPPLALHNP
jgi:hypothetical protein